MDHPINQSLVMSFTLDFDSEVDINLAISKVIKYRDPSGKEGSWIASIDGDGKLFYAIPKNTVNILGKWYVWPYVEFSDVEDYIGAAVFIDVRNPWDIIQT